MKYTFRGGIHPPDMKSATKEKTIKILNPPEKIAIPLQQHIGALLEPLVQVGELVKKGQTIGDSKAFVSSPVHASVSGKVIAIEPYSHPSGAKIPAIIIENDGKEEWHESVKPLGEYQNLSKETIIGAIRQAGIVGMGGAGFPTHIKLSPPADKKVEYLIVNGAECEPYLTSDHRVMLEKPNEVIVGLKAMMHLFSLKKGYIAIEENKKDAIDKLKGVTKNDPEIEICVMETKYPQGSEKHIIKAITGREVPSGKLPIEVGAIVCNIDTCTAISRVLKTGAPLIKRVVTVSGNGINNPDNFEVAVGTDFNTVIGAAGGLKEDTKKIIMGGPMMGISQFDLNTPVIKGTSGIIALTKKDILKERELPCLRCGRCVTACPVGLMPLYLGMYSKQEEFDLMRKYHISDCIECGSCSFVCPSKKDLVQNIRVGKAKLQVSNGKGGK